MQFMTPHRDTLHAYIALENLRTYIPQSPTTGQYQIQIYSGPGRGILSRVQMHYWLDFTQV